MNGKTKAIIDIDSELWAWVKYQKIVGDYKSYSEVLEKIIKQSKEGDKNEDN